MNVFSLLGRETLIRRKACDSSQTIFCCNLSAAIMISCCVQRGPLLYLWLSCLDQTEVSSGLLINHKAWSLGCKLLPICDKVSSEM